MSNNDQASPDDSVVEAYLEATRAVEAMPPARIDEVWSRLEPLASGESDPSDVSAVGERPRVTRSRRGLWIAASIAAAVLLAFSSWRSGLQRGTSQASAAAYRARSVVERRAWSAAKARPAATSSSSPTSPLEPVTPPSATAEVIDGAASPVGSEVGAGVGVGAEAEIGAEPKAPRLSSRSRRSREEVSGRGEERRAGEPTGPEPAASAGSSLAAETRALERARQALGEGSPARALELLDRYRREFPAGFLIEESTALRIVALCRAEDRRAAQAAADEFHRNYPGSALRARVARACPPSP